MTATKTPKVLILFVILALAGAVVVVGCGGGGSSSSESTAEESAAPPGEEESAAPPEEEEKEAGGESALVAEGKTVFAANCASCHTLKAAGASGKIGPNLDELEPDLATVEHQVMNGGGAMPAFGKEGLLNSNEVKAVATYVSTVAGTG